MSLWSQPFLWSLWSDLINQQELLVKFNEPLSKHTSLKMGGPADVMLQPFSERALVRVLAYAKDYQIPLTVIGGGTNLLVSDAGIRGFVLDTRYISSEIKEIEQTPQYTRLFVGASVHTVALVRYAVAQRLMGAHVLAGIPGYVGGAIIMNAGGHEGEIKDCTLRVKIATADGLSWIDAQNVGFSYRRSGFSSLCVIVGAELKLKPCGTFDVAAYVKNHMHKRQKTQPLSWPNAGSFFKNPCGDYAGRLIEDCGLKGYTVGGAEVSMVHANFLVKSKREKNFTKSMDFFTLIKTVRERVYLKHHIWLELEVRILGEQDEQARALLENNHRS